ncbi:uncharacterized protein Z519_10072 [Cladophialophora bantiana CBS 173.52]|uniref:6-methylsalicylate decarboxylase n=1 Tax=Cladophialophora bantiana (strain ATCC 10958 / CBS 173.52 / CDC B-1940 / NIH 8579) TaxID=1442370 RepID=A0A0D2HX83_CLAB1|nr:uncharacterized protein Z519_10072 [Cladophialophora bantiana CBS 173.52]KIW89219.1 hypothetical protein Z519_10072 [Cladophialophora bantiana CBS 173.52]
MVAWDIEAHLRLANQLNITKSYLSISSPGVHLVPKDNELARKLCRECNKEGADAKRRFPNRFGFWASLPIPDVNGSLDELTYAFDELQADGVAVMTNSHGYYLGHHDFEPVWAELDRRHAIAFVHPTTGCAREYTADGSVQSRKAMPLSQFPSPIFEFFFDTARAVINLFYSGTVTHYPNITYIIPHAGGCLPPLIERFLVSARAMKISVDSAIAPDSVKVKLKSNFYFGMAGTVWLDQLPNLLSFIDKKQALYGSDYPFTSAEHVKILAENMERFLPGVFTTVDEREMAYKKNAERLISCDKPEAARGATASNI